MIIKVNICIVLALFVVQSVMPLEIVKREEWGARAPKSVSYVNKTVPYVIIHHSYKPPACFSSEACAAAMKSMQRFHQKVRGWMDIGYNFAIGGDGKIYEGRGFNRVGAHAPNYNSKSIGICLIGDWSVPSVAMVQAAKDLIQYAVANEYLSDNYTLYGHRQVRQTACPGPALFNEISTWPHFQRVGNRIRDGLDII